MTNNALKISEACSLAMHAMAMLAGDPEHIFSTHQIAGELKGSEAHLSKVMQRLAKSGFVEAVRGPGGGFRLSGDPDKITLLDIYEVVEGPFSLQRCLLSTPICQGERCVLGGLVEKVNKLVYTQLQKTKISQLRDVFHRNKIGDSKHSKNR